MGDVWNVPDPIAAKVRYRQADQACQIETLGDQLKAHFELAQKAIAPGQAVVFYQGQRCLGGGRIVARGPTYFEAQQLLPEIVGI